MVRKGLVGLVVAISALVFAATQVLATDSNALVSTAEMSGAHVDLTLSHSDSLWTDMSVDAMTSSTDSNVGDETSSFSDVSLYGALTWCGAEFECRTIWEFYADGAPQGLTFDGTDGAHVSTMVSADIIVHDFTDANGNGDYDEIVAEFQAPISVSVDWTGSGAVNPGGGCFWNWDYGNLTLTNVSGSYRDAKVNGQIGATSFSDTYGQLFQGDELDKNKTKPDAPTENPCQSLTTSS